MRRLVTLGLFVLVLAALWSGGWFALAAWAQGRVSGVLAEMAERGVDVTCPERDMVGFPFALRVACGETEVSARGGGQAELGGMTGGASVFAPLTAQIALGSPATVQAALFVAPASLRWDATEIDVGMGLGGPQSVSFDAENLAAQLPLPDLADATLAAATAAGTLSPSDDGGTNVALAFSGLQLAANGSAFPLLNGSVSALLSLPPRALLAGRAALPAPIAARAMQISLTSGAARLDAAGDIFIDAEGILDGAVVLRVFGAEALSQFVAALPPQLRQLGNAVIGGMLAFGQATTVDGQPASELRIEIERGRARIGLVDLRVPRIPL